MGESTLTEGMLSACTHWDSRECWRIFTFLLWDSRNWGIATDQKGDSSRVGDLEISIFILCGGDKGPDLCPRIPQPEGSNLGWDIGFTAANVDALPTPIHTRTIGLFLLLSKDFLKSWDRLDHAREVYIAWLFKSHKTWEPLQLDRGKKKKDNFLSLATIINGLHTQAKYHYH